MFKPMLAGKVELEELKDLKFPLLVSPKLDGIRCVIKDGQALTRSLKPVPNKYIQAMLGKSELNGLDGEIMIKKQDFNQVQSAVMSEEGEPEFTYHVFDWLKVEKGFQDRFTGLTSTYKEYEYAAFPTTHMTIVPHKLVKNETELLELHDRHMKAGYEGSMIRLPSGPYKFGRSTLKEQYLLKLKKFDSAEAIVLDFVEQLHNSNEAETNELGYTERSSAKVGMVPNGMLGALMVRNGDGKHFEIGTGFTEEQRIEIWKNKKKYLSKLVTYKHQGLTHKGKPRFPVFIGFRSELDIS